MKKHTKKKYLLTTVFIILIIAIGFLTYLTSVQIKLMNDRKLYIAMVNDQGITREDYQKELEITAHYFTWAQPKSTKPSSLEKDVLENMINFRLVLQYAQKNQITVSQTELLARYKDIVKGSNMSEEVYLIKIKDMYGIDKKTHLEKLFQEILKEKVQKKVGKSLVGWIEEQKSISKIVRF